MDVEDKTTGEARDAQDKVKREEAVDGEDAEEVDKDIVGKVAAYSTSSICALSAFFGGIVAQEIVKFTGKYTPLK